MTDGNFDFVNDKLRNELVRGRPRSVLAVLVNNTEAALKLVPEQIQLGSGTWKQEPVRIVQPRSRAVMICQTSGIFTANRGTVVYASVNSPDVKVALSWNYPLLGERSCSFDAKAPVNVKTIQKSEGSLFEAVFTVSIVKPLSFEEQSNNVMSAALAAATAAATSAANSAICAPTVNKETIVPFQLLVGQAVKNGAFANVLDASNPDRMSGMISLCSFSYAGEAINEDFARKFSSYDAVFFSRFPNKEMLMELHRLFRKSHRYCMILSEDVFPSTGVMLVSKAKISKTVVPCAAIGYSATTLDRLTVQAGGAYACKLDISPILNASLWVFHFQSQPSKRPKTSPASTTKESKKDDSTVSEEPKPTDPSTEKNVKELSEEEKAKQEEKAAEELAAAEELRKLDERVQQIMDDVDRQSADSKLGIPHRGRKLRALRSFVSDVLSKENVSTDTGVFIVGDFGYQNVQDGIPRESVQDSHQMDATLQPLVEKLFSGDCVAYSVDITRELHKNNLPVFALMPLRKLVKHPRGRALLLTEMVTMSWKSFIVRKLSREFTGQATQTFNAYRRFVMECLERIAQSWNKDGPVFANCTEYWTKFVKEDIDQLFRPFLPAGDKSCVIDEEEFKPEYDLRETLQEFQLLRSFCKHFHVRITASVIMELLDGKRSDIPESAIEECRVPGLFTDSTRPTRKISSEHIMSMLYLDALDTALSTRAGKQRGQFRLKETTANIFCLDHIPTDSFNIFPTGSGSSSKSPLAVVNLLESESVAFNRMNYAVVSSFAITTTGSSHM